jgi:D-glycero-alpha-D-manno-heptose-7-phosphate kinase
MNVNNDVEIHYDGDLPSRSGVGSSSAFTVGLLNALYAYIGKTISPKKLANESIHIEQMLVGEQVGSQDQVCAAYGGLNKIQFQPNGDILTEPIISSANRGNLLNERCMLFFTGIARTASEVAETYVSDIASKAKQLHRIYDMVDDAMNILTGSGDLEDFGLLLHEFWMEKRSLSRQVSNSYIDEIYEAARAAGALGGKLVGAGGGGMVLLFVPLERKTAVREKLSKLIHVPFQFEPAGSRIIFQGKQQRYEEGERWRSNSNAKFFDRKDFVEFNS